MADHVIDIDPALRQRLLRSTGSTSVPADAEAGAEAATAVVARLDPEDSRVPGLEVVSRFGGVVTGRVRLRDLFTVRAHPAVRSLKASRSYAPTLGTSVPEIRARARDLRLEEPYGGLATPLTGRNVVVAVLDWGLDVTHANFRHPDGRTRLLGLWDQRGGRTPLSPEPFGYGRHLDAATIDAALASDDPHRTLGYDHADVDPRGEGTHGTHVADIAVGNGRAAGSAPGVAPGADLLFVHLRGEDTRPEDTLGDSARLLEAVDWAVRTASPKPVVVHASLGRTGGPHDASPLLVRGLDHLLATTPGVAVVMSCGNYRDSRMHAELRVSPGATVELPWQVPAPPPQGSELEVWYAGSDRLVATVLGPDGREVLALPPGAEQVFRGSATTPLVSGFHRMAEPNSGANMIDVFVLPGAPTGTYRLRLRGEDVADGTVHAWIERAAPGRQARFPLELASPDHTTGSICNGWLPLAVGAYDAKSASRAPVPFSSEGPSRDGRPKPDVSAPGWGIVAARSSSLREDGTRSRDGVVAKSGTSMAAPHVSGVVALVFEALAPRLVPMALIRWILLETARPPGSARLGAGRVDARAACLLARALGTPVPGTRTPGAVRALDRSSREEPDPAVWVAAPPAHHHSGTPAPEGGTTMTRSETLDPVVAWLAGKASDEAATEAETDLEIETDTEIAVGQLRVGGSQVLVDTRPPHQRVGTLDEAVRAALARTTEHTVVAEPSPGVCEVGAFGPATSLPAPAVAELDAAPGVRAVLVNGGDRVYVPAADTGTRAVDVPGLYAFYQLPAAEADQQRNVWAGRLATVSTTTPAQARDLGIPVLRVALAREGAAAFPVTGVRRGSPSYDAGGVVHGITLPGLTSPLVEPHCYLPVIARVEGKLESINAWDAGAGVSLGPIQFNADRAALFGFLWRLWAEDPDLFGSALTAPLGWRMAWHGDHPDLAVTRGTTVDVLHGRSGDRAANAQYLMLGRPGVSGRDPDYRRRLAGCLRDCVVWPHVQQMVVDVSAWWLGPALSRIRAAGVGPLDVRRPDRATFVLTALLLSAAVRFSGCLAPILTELGRWHTVADKLAHWEDAVNAAGGRCTELLPRLRAQRRHAEQVHDQALRLLGAAPASTAEGSDAPAAEAFDATVAEPAPVAPAAPTAPALSATRSAEAQAWNARQHPTASGVTGTEIAVRVLRHVDLAAARALATSAGATGGTAPFDAACVEAVHQFQASVFLERGQIDGKAGGSTLDTLGLVRRTGLNPVAQANAAAQRVLNRVDARLAPEFTASTWWEGMVNPGWLGQRFSNGIHLVLARKLRQAEGLLRAQPAYAGLTGVALGRALGIGEGHKGARPTASSASMHTFGLAVDIEYRANPWIVGQHVDGGAASPSPAGQVTRDANRRMTATINRASLLVRGVPVNVTAAYLSRLGAGDAGTAWDDLHALHTAFVAYLAVAGNTAVARVLVDARSTVPGVVNPGETPATAAQRWADAARSDLTALRAGPVTARNARGVEVSVAQSNFTGRDPLLGFLSLRRALVVALRDGAGLAWGAIDFGASESGDIMHFDCRRDGLGAVLRNG